jgi:hypothetical protein
MSQLKNFRLKGVSLRHLQTCLEDFELPSEVAVIKVALKHLYDDRKNANAWKIFQHVQRDEIKE